MVMVSKNGGGLVDPAATVQQNTPSSSNNGFSIAEVLASFVSHWYWFIISLAMNTPSSSKRQHAAKHNTNTQKSN